MDVENIPTFSYPIAMLNPLESLVKDLMTAQIAYDKACTDVNTLLATLVELKKHRELVLEELRIAKKALADKLTEDIESEVVLNGR